MTDITGERLLLRLVPEPPLIASARAFVASVLQARDRPEQLIEDARLVVSELVTPLIRDQLGPIELEVDDDGSSPVLTVRVDGKLPGLNADVAELVNRLTANGLQQGRDAWRVTFAEA